MRALQTTVLDGQYRLAVTNVPKPALQPDYLLVKVMASAVNPSDVMNSKGGFPHTTFPRIPGRDFAGIVIEPASSPLYNKAVYGTSGKHLSFTSDGAHAEFVAVPPGTVAEKPENLSFAQASAVGTPFTTAYLALKSAQAKAGETVMVIGATGAVGSAAVRLAKKLGCRVLTVSRQSSSSINSKEDPELNAVDGLTNGKGPEVVIDAVGDLALIHNALSKMAVGGRLAFISVGRTATSEMTIDMKSLYRKEQGITGCNSAEKSAEEMAGYLSVMKKWFEGGDLEGPDEAGLTKVGIESALEAYEAKNGKYVITFSE